MTNTTHDSSAHGNVLRCLERFESPNVTYISADGSWPIVWRSAHGVRVVDARGKRYLDLTAAFGVAAAGHANPRVIASAVRQMRRLLHAMGDVHPHALKADLVRELSRLTFERWSVGGPGPRLEGRTVLGNSGFEAVEAALKTAMLATGRRGVLAFEGGYHGLGYGTLNVTHRCMFRVPFLSQLGGFGRFLPFPKTDSDLERLERKLNGALGRGNISAILVEPIQGRGGIRVPPDGFLRLLRRVCDTYDALLVLDEVYTGFGRTGFWFAAEAEQVVPDLICLGKALTGGFPLSACVGRSALMSQVWPRSTGEALHTSTFLGHPVGCAMALAQVREIERLGLVARSARLGQGLLVRLREIARGMEGLRIDVRGRGLMVGLALADPAGRPAATVAAEVVSRMLEQGFLVLPEGEHGEVVGLTPPLTITRRALESALLALVRALDAAVTADQRRADRSPIRRKHSR
jgi:4-aminobutyrate aminotransferase-like enzyme